MIRSFFAGLGQVAAVFLNAALAQPKVRDLRRQVAYERRLRREGDEEFVEALNALLDAVREVRSWRETAERMRADIDEARAALRDAPADVAIGQALEALDSAGTARAHTDTYCSCEHLKMCANRGSRLSGGGSPR